MSETHQQRELEREVPVADPPPGATVVDLDPYSEVALLHPEVVTQTWIGAGPTFWCRPIGAWAMAGYDEVRQALRDWEHFSSAGGNGILDRATPGFRQPSALLDADPPEHTRNRGIVSKVLARMARKPDFERWRSLADSIVDTVVETGHFDAVRDLSEIYGHAIVPGEIGIKEYRPELMHIYGLAGGNARYPYNDRYHETMSDPRLPAAREWVDASCRREGLHEGGWGAAVLDDALADGMEESHGELIVRSLVSAGVENTIRSMAGMIYLFASNPDQWEVLRDDPSLARNAVEECMRLEGSTYQLYRTTAREVHLDDQTIPVGEKVLLLLAIANRDPRRWDDPHRFDIRRKAAGQLGFGFGPHLCVGQAVARQEMLGLLSSLAERVRRLEFAHEPVRLVSNTSRGFVSLPIRVEAA